MDLPKSADERAGCRVRLTTKDSLTRHAILNDRAPTSNRRFKRLLQFLSPQFKNDRGEGKSLPPCAKSIIFSASSDWGSTFSWIDQENLTFRSEKQNHAKLFHGYSWLCRHKCGRFRDEKCSAPNSKKYKKKPKTHHDLVTVCFWI